MTRYVHHLAVAVIVLYLYTGEKKLITLVSFMLFIQNGSTPLHLACWKGDMETSCRLLDWGASAILVDDAGNTALHEAAAAGHGDIMEKLIELGVPASSRNEVRGRS